MRTENEVEVLKQDLKTSARKLKIVAKLLKEVKVLDSLSQSPELSPASPVICNKVLKMAH